MKIKTIRVYPSEWSLDIIIGGSVKDLETISKNRYGIMSDFITHNECTSIDSSKDSELKGERRVVVILKSLNKMTIVHELIHAIWHLSQYIGYRMTYETQEWQAILFEYLYSQVVDKKGYKIYDSNKH